MNDKNELTADLKNTVNRMDRFISEVLMPRPDLNKKLLSEFKEVLREYQVSNDLGVLYRLVEIDNRPAVEGADTDYTTGTYLPLDGKYTSLMDLISEIQDLVTKIRKS